MRRRVRLYKTVRRSFMRKFNRLSSVIDKEQKVLVGLFDLVQCFKYWRTISC